MITTRKFWNVSTINSPDDEGIVTTFDNARAAADFAELARAQGLWFVEIWS